MLAKEYLPAVGLLEAGDASEQCRLPGSAGAEYLDDLARRERAATWRREGGHRYVPCAINAVRRVATKNAGLPCLVPAGRATA